MTLPWVPEGRLSADGKTLEYACWGPDPSQAPTLVMLHEGLGCTALWRDLPEALAQDTGFGVFAYSRAGYGQSDLADLPRPLDYMTREAEVVLPQVLDAVGIKRCVLLGHSDGATIAALYAGGVFDSRVRAVIAIAPHFFTESMGLAEIAAAKQAFEAGDLRQRMAKYHIDPDHTFRGWNDCWLNPDFASWSVSDVIDYIRVPVLAIQGRQDPYGTLAQIEELETRCYAPVETLLLDDCRHAPFFEHSEAVRMEIKAFCARLERMEAAPSVPA